MAAQGVCLKPAVLVQVALIATASVTVSYALYCCLRAGEGAAGPSFIGIAFALVLAAPLIAGMGAAIVMAAAVIALATGRRRDRDRAKFGECADCGYDAQHAYPLFWRVTTTWFIAAGAGFVMGEFRMNVEEYLFRKEAAAVCARTGQTSYHRVRAWPAGSSGMVYDAVRKAVWTTD
jgi:hypothetical protein